MVVDEGTTVAIVIDIVVWFVFIDIVGWFVFIDIVGWFGFA